MKIKLTSVYVEDQDKALAFYTEKLGFQKKMEFQSGDFKWLTVVSPEDPDGTELVLEANTNPAAKALQQSLKDQGSSAANFYSADVQGDYDRIVAKGVTFITPPMKTTGSVIAMLDDTCANLIQLTQLTWGG